MPLSPGALARTVITMAEAKSAALQRLAVPSCYSSDLATGTGTDQYCIAAPLEGARTLKYVNPHMKFGEIVGLAVRDATLEALRWQNGLEASYTRGLFHALGRYGIKETTIYDRLAPLLDASSLDLLRKNNKSVFYEPLVGAAAHAPASVLDRARFGTLPPSLLKDAIVQQAASLAASLAAKPDRWPQFRAGLHAATVKEPVELCPSRHRARLEREVEGLTAALSAQAYALAVAVLFDLAFGDPVYRFHPVRLMGASLTAIENGLRRLGADGYGGGIALFVILAVLWVVIVALALFAFAAVGTWPRGYSMSLSSTACSRSAICFVTSGGSNTRSSAAILLRRERRSAGLSAATPTAWTRAPAAAPPSRA